MHRITVPVMQHTMAHPTMAQAVLRTLPACMPDRRHLGQSNSDQIKSTNKFSPDQGPKSIVADPGVAHVPFTTETNGIHLVLFGKGYTWTYRTSGFYLAAIHRILSLLSSACKGNRVLCLFARISVPAFKHRPQLRLSNHR
jgi:hypothetical protein